MHYLFVKGTFDYLFVFLVCIVLVLDLNSYSTCLIQNRQSFSHFNDIALEGTPVTRIDCSKNREEEFSNLLTNGVDLGCSVMCSFLNLLLGSLIIWPKS